MFQNAIKPGYVSGSHKLVIVSLIFSFFLSSAFAQKKTAHKEVEFNTEFEKANFNDPAGFKEAVKNLKIGDSWYNRELYNRALEFYLKANEFNPKNADLNLKIGHCYLYSDTRSKAIPFIEHAAALDKTNAKIHYYLGLAYHLNMEWDKAIKEYKLYEIKSTDSEEKKTAKKKQEECKVGKLLAANPVKVKIENIGSPVNTEYPEYAPLINADESVLIFVSRRPDTQGGGKDMAIDDYFEDLYIATRKDSATWNEPENMGPPVNSKAHDGTVYLTPDGQTLYIYRDDNGDGNIYECKLEGTTWSAPKKLSNVINSKYQEPSATFSPDGNTIYFVSARPGGLGGKDIYMSKKNDRGEWTEPVNMGSNINTELDEDGVFMHPDGRTLYFSSQGHNTMGGYDIFKTTLGADGKWSKPQNLGYPINTPDEDIFFSISASGEHAYYSSIREGGKGSRDIYRITFLRDTVKKDTVPPTPALTILKGIITDEANGNFLEASIEITDNEKNQTIAKFKSNSSTGKYLLSLPSGKNYGIAVNADGYLFHSENVDIPESKGYQVIERNIALKKLTVGSKIVLNNIFFDFDKSTLRDASITELGRLIKLLNDNPKMKIELSAHTDDHGSAEYNQKLSENRAKAVVDYLVDHGIDKGRLKSAGYGKTRPVAPNENPDGSDNPDGRQLNRRTEFEILSN